MTKSYYEEYYNYLYNDELPRVRASKEKEIKKMTERIKKSFEEMRKEGRTGYIIRG